MGEEVGIWDRGWVLADEEAMEVVGAGIWPGVV